MMRSRWPMLIALAGAALASAASCKGEILPPQGEIVLIIETDVTMPDSIDRIEVELQSNGVQKFSKQYEVGGVGKLSIPATLGVLQGPDPLTPILFRVLGRRNGTAKTLREVLTTIPSERVAALRMPIRWMCDDTAADKLPITSPPTVETKRCPTGQTCIGGDCYGPQIDSSLLPDYTEGDRGAGACFDVVACMAGGTEVQMDVATCTFAKPLVTTNLNVALKVQNDGICDATKASCFVILDHLTTPGPLDGWRERGDKIELTPEVCRRLTSTPKRIESVVTSTSCPAKPVNLAVCGPMNLNTTGPGPITGTNPPSDAGPDADGGTLPGLDGGTHEGESLSAVHQTNTALSGTSFIFRSSTPNPGGKVFLNVVDLNTGMVARKETSVAGQTRFFKGAAESVWLLDVTFPSKPDVDVFQLDLLTQTANLARTLPNTAPIVYLAAGDADRMYWSRGELLNNGGSLWSGLHASSGSDTVLATIPTSLRSIRGFTADDDSSNGFVYVAIGSAGGAAMARIERVAKSANNAPLSLVTQLPTTDVTSPILDGADLYALATNNVPGTIKRTIVHAPAAGGSTTVRYADREGVSRLTVDGNDLYWLEPLASDQAPKRLMRAPKSGVGQPTELAALPVGPASLFGFAVGPDRIFYLVTVTTPPSWSLVGINK